MEQFTPCPVVEFHNDTKTCVDVEHRTTKSDREAPFAIGDLLQ